MRKIFLKENILFLIIYGFSLIFSALLIRAIYPIQLQLQKPIFFDLIELNVIIPYWLIYFAGSINIFLIWMIAKRFIIGHLALIPVLIYCFSPWSFYLVVTNSFYVYLLTFILIIFQGILLIKSRRFRWGMAAFILGSILFLYSFVLGIFIFPILITGLSLIKFVSFKKIRPALFIISFLCLPLLIANFKNQAGTGNIYNNQVALFKDPGHMNAVNVFQGESRKAGYSFIVKLGENRYIYFSKYAFFKAIKHFTPSTYFTGQEGLLKFSFSPPVYFGFLIPFLYGLSLLFKSPALRNGLAVSFILLVPSFVSKTLVNLNRLVLFEPVIVFVISLGMIKIIQNRKERIFKLMLFLTIILVSVQLLVTVFDINFREYIRYERYLGGALQIGD